MSKKTIMVGDIGATKCATAIVEYDSETKNLSCKKQFSTKLKDHQSLQFLFDKVESHLAIKMSEVDAICIGAAGIYNGEQLLLESGYPFDMVFANLAKKSNWAPFTIIHDYAPIVCATFTTHIDSPHHIKSLNDCKINQFGRRVALGIGTGLGLKDGILFPDGNFWLGTNEMGHIGITQPPMTDHYYLTRHKELIVYLHAAGVLKQHEPLSFEKILSGRGVVRLHQFIHRNTEQLTPEEIGQIIRDGHAQETLDIFAWYLGLFISTVQLTFMPDGGIWITGGVALNHIEAFDSPEFFKGIEASPAYLDQRKQFPLTVLQHTDHAFMGGAYYAVKRLLNL